MKTEKTKCYQFSVKCGDSITAGQYQWTFKQALAVHDVIQQLRFREAHKPENEIDHYSLKEIDLPEF